MVISRATGIPYRQNDLMISKESGRVLVRSEAVRQLQMTENDFCMLHGILDGRMILEVRPDPYNLLGQHVTRVKGQVNMQFYARQMARQWCLLHKVSQLRLRILSAVRLKSGTRLVELERVDDMCEVCHFVSRAKREVKSEE